MEKTSSPTPAPGGATPFSAMKSEEESYHLKVGMTDTKHVHFEHKDALGEAVDKLTAAVDNLTYQQEMPGTRPIAPPPHTIKAIQTIHYQR